MKKRSLGSTDIEVSEITLGTWGLAAESYGPVTDEVFEATVKAALEEGVTTFDMAPLWGDGRGEKLVGRVVGAKRDEVVYVTRAGAVVDGGELKRRFDRESLVKDCEGSLERLGTDRIDVWLLHMPFEDVYEQEEWKKAIEELKTAGKIRAWGVAVTDDDQARLAMGAGAQALCLPYNILHGDVLHDLAGDIATAKCGVLARSPLLHGILSGRWFEDRRFVEGDHRRDRWTAESLRERIRHVNMLRFLVHDQVRNMVSASIRFVLSNSVVSTAVSGARNVSQIEEVARSADGPPYLAESDMMRLPQVLASANA